MTEHLQITELSYSRHVKKWLAGRYGKERAVRIWHDTKARYSEYLTVHPDIGGKRNGHADAVYGGLLILALYPSLPDKPPLSEVQPFVNELFFGYMRKAGRFVDLNRPVFMRLIDKIFRRSGDRDRKDILKYPAGYINIGKPYDKKHRASRYCFTQCPNAEFARKQGLLHVLPLLCNSDYYGISALHGTLIRRSTRGNGSVCDYCIVGDKNPLARKYDIVTDGNGFLVSRKKQSTEK